MSFEENPMARRILMMKDKFVYKRLENNSVDGVALLLDLRKLEKEYGLGDTFEFDWRMYDYELFVTFWEEFLYPMSLSFSAVIAVILLITADIVATLVVALCVLMTDIFLGGLMFYWGLSANPVVMVQVVLGIGCSVDFSAHIAYSYLVEVIPK